MAHDWLRVGNSWLNRDHISKIDVNPEGVPVVTVHMTGALNQQAFIFKDDDAEDILKDIGFDKEADAKAKETRQAAKAAKVEAAIAKAKEEEKARALGQAKSEAKAEKDHKAAEKATEHDRVVAEKAAHKAEKQR